MTGCIYRTKDGECGLWEKDRNHSPFCRHDCDHKHPSNADRIRAMTDEELAEWVWSAESDGRAYGPRGKKAWLDWLRQINTIDKRKENDNV